jgi:molybdopterin converting factor subunit 1
MDELIHVDVLFFAKSREVLQRGSASLALPVQLQRREVVALLEAAFPELKVLKGVFVLALNEEYVEEDRVLSLASGDTLAVIPPISGG